MWAADLAPNKRRGLSELSVRADVFMVADELPCQEDLFIQQLEGGAVAVAVAVAAGRPD